MVFRIKGFKTGKSITSVIHFLLLFVAVESFAGLHTNFAFFVEFVEGLHGIEKRLFGVLLVPAVEDELASVQADVISELEWAHWVPSSELHRDIFKKVCSELCFFKMIAYRHPLWWRGLARQVEWLPSGRAPKAG